MHAHICTGRTKAVVRNLPPSFFYLLYLAGLLNQTQNSLTWLGLLASLLWRSPFPSSEAGITNRLPCPPDIFAGFWGITFQSSHLYCKQFNHQGTSLAVCYVCSLSMTTKLFSLFIIYEHTMCIIDPRIPST